MRKLDAVPAQESVDAPDDLITIEAPTVEEAMNRLAAEVGDDARIVSAEKVPRGGVGGFFAKEMVVLTAHRPEHDRSGLPGVLERMTEDADLRERAFGDVLRAQLENRETSAGLGSLLDAAGWSIETPRGDVPEAPGAADGRDTAADAPAMTSEISPPPAPVSVGPLVGEPNPAARPATAMPEATVVERIASEHLVSNPPSNGIRVPGLTAAMDALDLSPNDLGSGGRLHPTPNHAVGADTAMRDATTQPDPTQTEPLVTHGADADIGLVASAPAVQSVADGAPSAFGTDAPAGLGRPSWNVTELVRHGLPAAIVTAVRDLDPLDDLAWINAVAGAVAPWCGVLPAGDRVVVGTGADRLAATLDLSLVRLGDVAPYAGSFCSVLTGAPDDRAWLDFVKGGRYLHFVLGEDELWRDLLVADPAVVSWVSPTGLIDSLYLASTLGATLGYGALEADAPMLRAQPVDVALGLRSIIGRS